MTDTIGEAACSLAGLAARMLGWKPPDFWSATPADLGHALGNNRQADAPLTRKEMLELMMKGQPDG